MLKTYLLIGLMAVGMVVIAVGCRSSERYGSGSQRGQTGFFSGNHSAPFQGGGGIMGSGSRNAP